MSEKDLKYSDPVEENKKRKREYFLIFSIGLLFLFLTWVEFKLFGISQSLPFMYSIFFFGLVNFNIILFLILIFFLFRNIAKSFTTKESGFTSKSLKAKLITAFVGFSFVPTALMFLISVFYINNSFEKWFNHKMMGVLKSSLEITNTYFIDSKEKNYHFAEIISKSLKRLEDKNNIKLHLTQQLHKYQLGTVEYYDGLWGDRTLVSSLAESIPDVPPVSLEFRKKGVTERLDSSTIFHFGKGNLIRVIVPSRLEGKEGAIVVSTFVPLSLISKMDDIASAYENFKDTNTIAYPLKTIYLIILVLMTMTILLFATWFGFYLAKHLSIPLVSLSEAATGIAKGEYKKVEVRATSPEINQLVSNFNIMSEDLEAYQNKISKANSELKNTLTQLDESSRYLQVVLENVNTGVISVNNDGIITMLNDYASTILGVTSSEFIGKHVSGVLSSDKAKILEQMLRTLNKTGKSHVDKEVQMPISGRMVPLQLTLSLLKDENEKELGRVLVFHDLTVLVNAQRTAAWREVAKRIAHEIKNPLTPIKLSAQRLQKKFSDKLNDQAFEDCTSTIIDQVDNIKGLVNEFSLYARLPKPELKSNDLNSAIHESLSLFRQAHKDVSFNFTSDDSLPNFYFDRRQMQRVITNLVDNSFSAGKKTKNLKVDISTHYIEDKKLAKILVSDNGEGVSSGVLAHIFEPYVTTKEDGSGLGLAIVKKTIEDHDGSIIAKRSESGGLEMKIELPVLDLVDKNLS